MAPYKRRKKNGKRKCSLWECIHFIGLEGTLKVLLAVSYLWWLFIKPFSWRLNNNGTLSLLLFQGTKTKKRVHDDMREH